MPIATVSPQCYHLVSFHSFYVFMFSYATIVALFFQYFHSIAHCVKHHTSTLRIVCLHHHIQLSSTNQVVSLASSIYVYVIFIFVSCLWLKFMGPTEWKCKWFLCHSQHKVTCEKYLLQSSSSPISNFE